jgi:hypothetical protein
LALAVPLSRFPSRVGGGSAFFVRPHKISGSTTPPGENKNKTHMTHKAYNPELVTVMKTFSAILKGSKEVQALFSKDPTGYTRRLIVESGIDVPQEFHSHAIKVGAELPAEPKRATIDRYVYVFRSSGLFEFKIVPGSPTGDDSIMQAPPGSGACCCCNCCVFEVQ